MLRFALGLLAATQASAATLGARSVVDMKVGRLVPLRHPTSGRLDRKAQIVDAFVEVASQLPVATVRYHDGVTRPVAADRIRLIGRSLGEQRAYLRHVDGIARQAIAGAFGLAPQRRAITQPERRLVEVFQKKVQPGAEPVAYYHQGRVVLERDFYAFEASTRIHEYIHALASPAWNAEVKARGHGWLDEGVAELLTQRACRRADLAFPAPQSYVTPRKVARAVERVVGREALDRAFFRDGLLALELAYDSKMASGAFGKLMRFHGRAHEAE